MEIRVISRDWCEARVHGEAGPLRSAPALRTVMGLTLVGVQDLGAVHKVPDPDAYGCEQREAGKAGAGLVVSGCEAA